MEPGRERPGHHRRTLRDVLPRVLVDPLAGVLELVAALGVTGALGGRAVADRPETSTTTGSGSKWKSTRPTPGRRAGRSPVEGRGRPARRTTSRNRRSSIVCPPESTTSRSSVRTPQRPDARMSVSRCLQHEWRRRAGANGAVDRRLEAEPGDPQAGQVDDRPRRRHAPERPDVRPVDRRQRAVVWIRNGTSTPRRARSTVNSTAPATCRSRPCSAAAASWLTQESSPRLSSPIIRSRSHEGGAAGDDQRPAVRRAATSRDDGGSAARPGVISRAASWSVPTTPCCCPASRAMLASMSAWVLRDDGSGKAASRSGSRSQRRPGSGRKRRFRWRRRGRGGRRSRPR